MKTAKNVLLRSVITVILSLIIALNAVLPCLAQITLKGDLNGDGVVNSEDFIILRKALLNEIETEYDINGDGEFNLKDLVRLKKIAVDFDENGKFLVNCEEQLINITTYKLGELFQLKDGSKVDSSEVEVEFTYDDGIKYEFTKDNENWENSTVKFEGTGSVEISIYEYCTPTKASFTVINADKFNVKTGTPFDVPASSEITLGDIFEENGFSVDSSNVAVEIQGIEEHNIVYNQDNENWVNSTLKFNALGNVTVKISESSDVEQYTFNVVLADKFESKDVTSLNDGQTVNLGALFNVIGDFEVNSSEIEITAVSESDTVKIIDDNNENDWKERKLTFNGVGEIKITIKEILSNPLEITIDVSKVDKFEAKAENVIVDAGSSLKLGELFSAKFTDEIKPIINSKNVTVTLYGEEYKVDVDDWTEYSIEFNGTGDIVVEIKENSNPTTVTVKVNPIDKFDIVFENTDKYLYRVGNQNTVALGSLFKAKDGVTVDSVSVNVETDSKNSVSATYTANTSDWTKGTIKFSGTGPVTITIKDSSSEICELTVEVVEAKNITKAESATSNNVVLMNNISGSFSVSGNYTFYGNGFTVTLPKTSVTNKGNGFCGYINLNNGHLDNVNIVGPVYPEQYIYRTQAEITNSSDADYGDGYNMRYFHNSVIVNAGDCNITNSRISGSRTAVYIKDGGNVLLENTTVSGGAYANIQVAVADSVTFKDLTTEQVEVEDSYNAEGNKKKMIGLGIVIDNAETEIYIEGTLNQFNWITQAQWENLLGDYVNQFPKLFTDTTYQCYWHYRENDSTTKYVNLTMIFACDWDSNKLHDNREVIDYKSMGVTVATASGGVYSTSGLGTLTDKLFNAPKYVSSAYFAVPPKTEFDYITKNYVENTEGSNDFCYEDNGIVKISFDVGNSKVWDTAILTVTKGTNVIPYTVSMNGVDYTGKSITFTESGNYIVTYTYSDPYNYKLNSEGDIESYSKEYKQNVNITVSAVEAKAKNAEFTMGSNGQAVDKITINNNVYLSASGLDNSSWTSGTGLKFPRADGDTSTVSFKYSGKTNGSWASATINEQIFYFPVVAMGTTDNKWSHTSSWYGCFPVFEGAISITDYADGGTGAEVTYNSSTTTLPSNLQALYPQTVFRYQGTQSKVPTTPSKMTKGTYNGKLCYTTQTDLSASNERGEEWNLATYTYTDNKGTTYYWYIAYYCAASTNGSCFTPDTLITLADGSQKRVDELQTTDKILAWDFFTGSYIEKDISLLVNHGDDFYRIANLKFSDNSSLRIIAEHGIFDYDLNKFVYITVDNMYDYVGHRFVKYAVDGSYEIVTLTESYETEEYTSAWSVSSAITSNAFASGLLTVAPPEDFYNWIEMDGKLQYDVEQFAKDVETYGLYTYEDFKDYVTYEQFVAWNGAYLKIPVKKGYFTYDYILELIELYKGWMP